MFSQILSMTLCLSLLLPAGRAEQAPGKPPEPRAIQGAYAGAERVDGDEFDRSSHAIQSDELQTTTAKTQTTDVTELASPQVLSQEEEASLAARAEEPGPEVSGGALSTLHLTYAVIALGAIVLVLLVK